MPIMPPSVPQPTGPNINATPTGNAAPPTNIPTDPRTVQVSQDPNGEWAIIQAADLPPGCPRSKTRDDPDDAMKANWEPGLTAAPGAGSIHKYVKVKRLHLPWEKPYPGQTIKPGDIGLDPAKFAPGRPKTKQIADYPHKCHVCGGRTLQLFSSVEHEGGKCPGPPKNVNKVAV
jgi:hypothetical protein